MRILLCTGNAGKVDELRAMLPERFEVVSLADAGLPADLPETGETLAENALQKARYAHARTGLPCLADDTGLEVDALGGAPGVRSARYAGEARDPVANMRRLLMELHGATERQARFRTVLAFVSADEERTFEGIVEGVITGAPQGKGGFGYDPVFKPLGSTRTFAEMSPEEKNAMSHRGRAMAEAVRYMAALQRRG